MLISLRTYFVMPTFSIVTICLNEEQAIARTCDSVCNQTFDDFEWIVIDGQSIDKTLEVLSRYESRIKHLVSESDAGIYDAMNKGIALATGDYLLFLNAGDCLASNDVLDVVAKAPDRSLLYGDLLCYENKLGSYIKSFPDKLPRNFLVRNMMPHQATFFKRSLFTAYGLYDTSLRIAADYEIFVRLLYVNKVSSFHVKKIVAAFHTNGISSDTTHSITRKMENHQVRKKYFPWFLYGLDRLRKDFKFKYYRPNH